MKRRPTRRALIIVLVALVLFMAATTAQAGWLFVLAAGALGLVVGSFLVRPPLPVAGVERSVPRRVRVGDEVRVGLQVHNSGTRTLPIMKLEDAFAAFDDTAVFVERVPAGSSATVALVVAGADEGVPPDSAFEAVVEAAASIARYAIVTGHPVDLVRAGPDGSAQQVVEPDRVEVLDWL